MPFDPSILLQAKGIDAPDPLQTAGRGVTLADMLMKMQQAQAVNAYWSQSLQGQQGSQSGQGMQGGQSPNPFGVNMQALQNNPMAAGSILPSVIGMAQKQAETGKAVADTGKANQEVLDSRLKTLANYANVAAENPTAQNIQGYARQFQFTGLPADALGSPPDDPTDPKQWQAYFKQVSSIATSPEQRSAILKTGTMLPLEATKAAQDIGMAPAKLAIEQGGLVNKQQELALQAAKYRTGETFEVDTPQGKTYMVKQPGTDAQGNPTINIVPAQAPTSGVTMKQPATSSQAGMNLQNASPSDVAWMQQDMAKSGQQMPAKAPVFGMGAGQQEMIKGDAKTVSELNAQMPAAQQGLNTIMDMRNKMSSGQGIFSGPIQGKDFFKEISGILSQLPGAPQELKDKVSNTQAWDAQGGELAFNMLSSLKGSVPRAQSALTMIRAIKPNTMMTPDAQQQVMDAIQQRFLDQIDYAKRASSTISGGGSLADVELPAHSSGFAKGQQLQSMPPPSSMPNGVISVDGQMYKSDGKKWVTQ